MNDNKSIFDRELNKSELQLTPQICGFWAEIAKWAKFLSILGFIFLIFMVIGSFFMGAFFSAYSSMMGVSSASSPSGLIVNVTYLVLALIYVFPIYYLYRFSDNIQKALESNNNEVLTDAFRYLKSHYRFIGILCIVLLSIYAIFLIIAIVGGVMSTLV